ncbi:hypothetical protein AXF42_Ash018689 [Apostasia shenzhenica]|uniref:Galactose oxidase n=1 Tax=Apostasia shenzhenica TaxID=1088818 RepID=A0A2H9ZZQ7_9ASPA|nr:hypothetical protein AXF42_Ash018689 [Apostasia shenzhenica]
MTELNKKIEALERNSSSSSPKFSTPAVAQILLTGNSLLARHGNSSTGCRYPPFLPILIVYLTIRLIRPPHFLLAGGESFSHRQRRMSPRAPAGLPAVLLLLLLAATSVAAQFPFLGGGLIPGFGMPLHPPQLPEPGEDPGRLDHETAFGGEWEIVSEDAGVSAMHLAITHENRAIMFDATVFGPSHVSLPAGECRRDPTSGAVDCYAHAVEFDLKTYTVRPLKLATDPWCSSGGFAPDGTLISTGGWKDGTNAVRYIGACPTCDWRDYAGQLKEKRWYSTQQILGDGSFIVLGGRIAFNYEFVPAEKEANAELFELPFLRETTDDAENNLYPFVHLSPDGNLFVFANNRAILVKPRSGRVLRRFPPLSGGSRNYPASGMSALLPIDLSGGSKPSAQVLICGGSPPESFLKAQANKPLLPALKSCGRITITDPNSEWEMDEMPIPRTFGDMLVLPNGDLLIINGASMGCAGWGFAREPVLTPLLYIPESAADGRWKLLEPTDIPRMYHSSCALLPDASILVAGSNTNPTYLTAAETLFPTELRVEKFRPPYLDPALSAHRPHILDDSVPKEIRYRKSFEVEFTLLDIVEQKDIKVTLYSPPFTTHGFSMNQRLVVLRVAAFEAGFGRYIVKVSAPPSGNIAPPGWYMLFVVSKGLPSEAVWVHIKSKK